MDSINVEKILALRKYKQQEFVNTLFFYHLAAITFGLFCTSPFWFPSIKTFLCGSIPKILSFFFNVKSLFILGNLIVIFLVRESKVRTSDSSCKDDNNNNNSVKIPPKKEQKTGFKEVKIPSNKKECKTRSKEIKMYATLPLSSRDTVSEKCLTKTYVDLSTNGKIDEVGYVKENLEHETEVEAEEDILWQDAERKDNEGEEEAEMAEEKNNLENVGGQVVIPALSTDELKRRADDFIARVNKQIRLEADEVLACAC